MDKIVGPEGVFATVATSGWAMAIPNSDAPSRFAGALTRSPETHNNTVREYFVGAGLPVAQIGTVNAHATMHTSSTDGDVTQPVFDSYTSVITRAIDGIPVSDSFAVAEFNVNGDVVEESVYWPTLPTSVIDDARALRTKLANPSLHAAFIAGLPDRFADGQVMIRHSSGAVGVTFQTAASYDVHERVQGGLFRVRHFDLQAHEFKMLDEELPLMPDKGTKK